VREVIHNFNKVKAVHGIAVYSPDEQSTYSCEYDASEGAA
jgi:hypothetical protein